MFVKLTGLLIVLLPLFTSFGWAQLPVLETAHGGRWRRSLIVNKIDGGEVCRSPVFSNETIHMMLDGLRNPAKAWAALLAFRERCTPAALKEVGSYLLEALRRWINDIKLKPSINTAILLTFVRLWRSSDVMSPTPTS
jgi:hypothetical protein